MTLPVMIIALMLTAVPALAQLEPGDLIPDCTNRSKCESDLAAAEQLCDDKFSSTNPESTCCGPEWKSTPSASGWGTPVSALRTSTPKSTLRGKPERSTSATWEEATMVIVTAHGRTIRN